VYDNSHSASFRLSFDWESTGGAKKTPGVFCRNGLEGASRKRLLVSFSLACATEPIIVHSLIRPRATRLLHTSFGGPNCHIMQISTLSLTPPPNARSALTTGSTKWFIPYAESRGVGRDWHAFCHALLLAVGEGGKMCWKRPPPARACRGWDTPPLAAAKAFFPLSPDKKPACKKACQSPPPRKAQPAGGCVPCKLFCAPLSSTIRGNWGGHAT